MKIISPTCVQCIHSNVCKYKEPIIEKVHESLKTFVKNISLEEMVESGCKINVTCDHFSNGYNTITQPFYPIDPKTNITLLKQEEPIQTQQNPTIGDPAYTKVDTDLLKRPSIGDPVFRNPYEPNNSTTEKAMTCSCNNSTIRGTNDIVKDVSSTPTATGLNNLSGKMKLSKDEFYTLAKMYIAGMIANEKLKDNVEVVMNTISRNGGSTNIESFDWQSYFDNINDDIEFLV